MNVVILVITSTDSEQHQSSQSRQSLRGQGLGVCVSWVREEKMTGFHAHRHTSLLTRVRTHRLPRLISAQDPEAKAGLLPAEVNLHVLVLCSWSTKTTCRNPLARFGGRMSGV